MIIAKLQSGEEWRTPHLGGSLCMIDRWDVVDVLGNTFKG